MAAEKTQGRSTVDNDMNMTNAWDGAALETLLNSVKTKKVKHFVETSLTDAIERSTQELGAMVLCPNGIVINGMLVATPDQEIGLTTTGNKVRLTVDTKNIDITVPYATKAAQDSNGLAFSNYQLGINKLFLVQESDGSTTIKYTTIATNNDGSDQSRAATLGTFMLSTEIIRRLNDISSAQSQGMVFMGTIGADTKITSFNTAVGGEDMTGIAFANISGDVNVKAGWTFRNTVAQDLASNVHVEPGDMIILVNDVPNNRAIISTDYTIVQNNIDKATNDSLGLVKIGANINVDNDGTISVPAATKNALGVVKVGSTLDVDGGTIDAPTMTSERAGIAAVGSNLEIQTGHLGVKRGKGLKSDSDGSLMIEKPVITAGQGAGSTYVKVSIGRVESDQVPLPVATGQAYGTSLNDFGSNEKTKLDALNIIKGVCSTAAGTATKEISLETENMTVVRGAILVLLFVNTNTASSPKIKIGDNTYDVYYKGSKLSGSGDHEVFYPHTNSMFICDGDAGYERLVFLGNGNADLFEHAKYGGGYTTCGTTAATAAKTASLIGFALAVGGIVSVRFANNVPANATLNINSTGAKPIYWHNVAIRADTIKGGDTATFIYDGRHYMLIATDHVVKTVNVSVSESDKNVTDAKTEDYDKPVSVASAHYLFSALAQRIQALEDAMTWQ